ncbi:PQQ-binding-like beta-propeller repeat protein [Candidatus Sumerlaeota bacterium]|nr:PQQ-binding-like beta-propeller repeat protein [Candidatus Sumerlaeota bacterium]
MGRFRLPIAANFRAWILPALLLVAAVPAVRAENWPQWRGPRGDGIVEEKSIPTQWDKEKNILWKTEIPGEGHSSAIVWEESVFLATALAGGHDRSLVKINAKTGKIEWTKTVVTSKDLEHHHEENNFASSTPATDGNLVFTSFYADGRMNVAAHDFKGNQVWSVQPIKYKGEHGYHHNPIVYEDMVILTVNQFAEPCILALDKTTGKTSWKLNVENDSCSNVPPLVAATATGPQVLTCGDNHMRGIDPKTGRLIWSAAGPTDYCVASLSFGDNMVMACGGYPERHIMVVNTAGTGDVTNTHLVWELKKGTTYVPSPVYFEGHFYSVNDDGIGFCYEAKTGKIKWQKRIPGHYRSSLLLNGDNIYITSDEGPTTIFKASPEGYNEVAVNKLDDFVYTTFAVSNGKLYLRTKNSLVCIGTK